MRKLVSLILTVCILISAVPFAALAQQSSVNFLVAKSYNNEPTGALPEESVASGTARVVITDEGKDKSVELSGSKSDNSILYKVETDKNTVSVFFEIKFSKIRSKARFYVVGTDNKSFNIVTIDENGEVSSGDARISTVIPSERKLPVQITYNKNKQRASIYVDNKCLTSDRYMGASAPKTIGGFGIKVTGNTEGSCIVDNFAIFEGSNIIKSSAVPKMPYSDAVSVSAPSEDETEEFVGETVYVNRTFNEDDGRPELENIAVVKRKNVIKIEKSVFDDNKYIRLEKKTSDQSFIQYKGDNSARYVVAQADFSTEKSTPASQLFYIYDESSAQMICPVINLAATTGVVTTYEGLYVCTLEPLKWTNIAIALDSKQLIYDVYVNGERVLESVPIVIKTITRFQVFRTGCNANTGSGTLFIDNVRTYEGKAPRELNDTSRKSVNTPSSAAVTILGSMKAFEPFGNHIFTNGVRMSSSHDIIGDVDDVVLYAHEEDLKTVFGSDIKLVSPHSSELSYYDVCETAKQNGYLMKNVDTRLFLFSNTPIELSKDELDEVRRHMFHDRPSKEQLWADFEKTSKEQHPRILINQNDVDRIKELYKTDPLFKQWGDTVIESANSWFGRDDYNYRGGSWKTNGYQNVGEIAPFMNMMFAYHFTGNERYLARAWMFMETICLLPDWDPEITFLDVCELSFTVGLGYDWLYPYITQDQRDFLAKNLLDKGIELMRKVYFAELNDTGWDVGFYNAKNNWGAVTNGGAMCGAMAILDVYPETCLEVIYNANRCIEHMTGSFYPYGAWEEGGGYWNYALQYLTYTMLSLEKSFGTSYGLHDIPGLDKTGWYGSKLSGSTGMMTMGDAGEGFVNNRQVMALATRYKDAELMITRINEMSKFGHKPSAFELIYYDPSLNTGESKPSLDSYMEGMEVVSLREAWFDKTATYLGASGGNNFRNHGHMDIGSFVIDMAGIRFIHDVGGEDYNAKGGYFDKGRYSFYASRPEGHNLYIINPEEDNLSYRGQVSAHAKAKIVVSKPRGAIATMDLTGAYASWANSAKRGYMLSDDRRSVTVRDEIDLKGDDNYIYWFLHTLTEVEYIERNTAVLVKDGKKMQITVDCDAPDWSFEIVPSKTMSNVTTTVVADSNKESQGYKTLAVKVEGASGLVNITAKFKQYDDLMIDTNPTKLDISEWTIPDGEVTPLPVADMIYVDGKPVEDFDPAIGGYSILVPNKATVVPTVSVATSNRYEIVQSYDFGTDTVVKVYSPLDANVYRTYRINIYKMPPLKDIDGMRRYPVAEVKCIDTFEQTSPPANVIDQNYGTRWASEGSDQWITLELDDIYTIEKIGVSWMSGDIRSYKYKLEISEDGINWTTVFNGSSMSGTTALEYNQIGGKKAKFVRYIGYGNTVNKWNSVTEIAVLGNER